MQMLHFQLTDEEYKQFEKNGVVRPDKLPKLNRPLTEFEGLQRLVMLDRYSMRDNKLSTLKADDIVVATIIDDNKHSTIGYGYVKDFKRPNPNASEDVSDEEKYGYVTIAFEFPTSLTESMEMR